MKIKSRILILLCLCASVVQAAEVKLAWDASESANVTYRIYASTNGLPSANAIKVDAGTNLTATVSNLTAGTYSFAVSAISAQGLESDLSNIVVAEVPKAPGNMRTVILQTSFSVDGPWTNNHFFRIGFP